MEEPHLDAQPPTSEQQAGADPFYDLRIASANYWAGATGREEPPAPTYRNIGGKMMLGRYMDPYGCQAHIRTQRRLWDRWYTEFFIAVGIGVLFGPETGFLSLILAGIVLAPWYFWRKSRHTQQYNLYYRVQDEILQSGKPEWVPYDKDRLQLIEKNPMAVWP